MVYQITINNPIDGYIEVVIEDARFRMTYNVHVNAPLELDTLFTKFVEAVKGAANLEIKK